MSYAVSEYDPVTGKIDMAWAFSTRESLDLNTCPGVSYVEGRWDSRAYYIVKGEPTERPPSPVRLTGLTLQGVPAGSTLTIASASLSTSNGARYDNVEGDVELEFPLPGTYRLRVECWPYKDWEGEVVI
jgi:hypothetical protein